MIDRAAFTDLKEWLDRPGRKPILLRGARQVGKTSLVREFARRQGIALWEVNLEKQRSLDTIFASLDVNAVIREISLLLNTRGIGKEPGILFLDEIQTAPHALTCLRYFYEERQDIPLIAAGSLLEFTLREEGLSMPVGRIESCWLGPLSFEEYVAGTGEDVLYEELLAYEPGEPWPQTAHKRLMDRLMEYLIVGGMPEASQTFIDTADYIEAARVHRSLLETYRDDFSKYAQGSMLRKLQRIFEVAPAEVGKKVTFRRFHPDWPAKDIRHCLELLIAAGILNTVTHTSANGLPLGAEEKPDVYKLYFLDIGLVNTANGTPSGILEGFRTSTSLGDFINAGSVAEQFVSQQLWISSNRNTRPKLHYWLREGKSTNAEVDFLLPGAETPVPVEIKAGSTGTLRSLHQFMLRFPERQAIRLDASPPSFQEIETTVSRGKEKERVRYRLSNYPLYFAGRLSGFI